MIRSKLKRNISEYCVICVMAALTAVNYLVFTGPNNIAPAGVDGIAAMIQHKTDFGMGWFALIINIPLNVIAFIWVDREFAVKSFVYVVLYSLFYLLFGKIDFSRFAYAANNVDTVLPCVFGGVVFGFLSAVCIRCGGSTGGSETVAKLIQHKKPQFNFFWIRFCINVAVAAASFFVFAEPGADGKLVYDYHPVALCVLYCFISSFVGNGMAMGVKKAYKFVIVTKHSAEIEREIVHKLHRSATRMQGVGAYSNEQKDVVMCIVRKSEIATLQKVISEYPDTFACIDIVNETVGNFKKRGETPI